jgi:hypothetical protein
MPWEQVNSNRAYADSLVNKANEVSAAWIAEQNARIDGKIGISVGKNELAGLMETLAKAAKNGECFTVALQRFNDERQAKSPLAKYYNDDGTLDRFAVPSDVMRDFIQSATMRDSFWIDPNTGEITHASAAFKLGSLLSDPLDIQDRNSDAVWDLAYDLQQFIQIAFFSREGDCPVEIERLLAEIMERQANKCVARFVENAESEVDEAYGFDELAELIENEAHEFAEEAIDHILDFIHTIGSHQDRLYEELMKLLEELRVKERAMQMIERSSDSTMRIREAAITANADSIDSNFADVLSMMY